MDQNPRSKKCKSIKSRKHPDVQCPNPAVKGDWCAIHHKSQVLWESLKKASSNSLNTLIANSSKSILKLSQKTAGLIIKKFFLQYVIPHLHKYLGPASLFPELSHNDKDIYSYDSILNIPLLYRFSYIDSKKHIWLFDLRFLLQLLQHGKDLQNPFTQELIPSSVIERLQKRSNSLVLKKIPVVYIESDELTPEQLWNQKVLDVFLKFNSLGFGVNILWFESMNSRAHELFYEHLYDIWTSRLNLSEETKQKVIPNYNSGRAPLFRWTPESITGRGLELKWWRKMNLGLIKTFITRATDKENQSSGALYVLTALAEIHPHARTAFPWLV